MADIADDVPYADAATAISQGKRHLLVRDYTAAVSAFAEGLESLSRKYGDVGDELGEPYLLYGRALLGLARTETGVLGDGVLGSEETEDETNEDKDDTSSSVDDNEEDEIKTVINNENNGTTSDVTNNGSVETVENNSNGVENSNEKSLVLESTSDIPGSSKKKSEDELPKSNRNNNESIENKDDENNDVQDDDDDGPGQSIDLQVAWEVLELAKNVFSKRGSSGLKNLAEAHRLLGEVAMESGNHQVAVSDLKQSLKILENLEPYEFRAIAELHYQLGLVYSLINEFDMSIEQFNEAMYLLQKRIKQLQATQDTPQTDDPFYSIRGEIKELEELLPEIQEKITDIKDFKQEACQLVINELKSKVIDHANGSSSNSSATPSSENSHSSKETKPVSDISHLVRKKRRADKSETQNTSPCKKTS